MVNMFQSPRFKRIENCVKVTKKQMSEVKKSPWDPKQRVREIDKGEQCG